MTSSNLCSAFDSIKVQNRGASEYVVELRALTAFHNNTNVLCVEVTKIIPIDFSLIDWAKAESKNVIFFDKANLFLDLGDVWVVATRHGKSITLTVYGPTESKIQEWLISQEKYNFRKDGTEIKWLCGPDWAHVSIHEIPLEPQEVIASAYPWLNKSISQYAKDYFDDSASILILIGPPGTGKTSFLKGLINETGRSAAITYEEGLIREDGLFAYFMNNDELDMLIFEDADTYLGSRKDTGNNMMHRFLNVSNGLISPLKGKKIIFTTNLPSTSEIDPALMRPGRCYDVINFRALTNPEAKTVAREVYGDSIPALTQDKYTLAEVTNLHRLGNTKQKRTMGFTP